MSRHLSKAVRDGVAQLLKWMQVRLTAAQDRPLFKGAVPGESIQVLTSHCWLSSFMGAGSSQMSQFCCP